jgi:hypothetical protein
MLPTALKVKSHLSRHGKNRPTFVAQRERGHKRQCDSVRI